jgi:hypothetical protein
MGGPRDTRLNLRLRVGLELVLLPHLCGSVSVGLFNDLRVSTWSYARTEPTVWFKCVGAVPYLIYTAPVNGCER